MNLDEYTYEHYEADWRDLRGHVHYWLTSVGSMSSHVSLMSETEFREAVRHLQQLLKDREIAEEMGPDELEGVLWEIIDAKIPLLLAGKRIE